MREMQLMSLKYEQILDWIKVTLQVQRLNSLKYDTKIVMSGGFVKIWQEYIPNWWVDQEAGLIYRCAH
jgi:hypothetical protein